MPQNLLEVQDLSLSVPWRGRYYPVLKHLSFDLPEAGSLGIVGESGSGKSLTAMAIAGLGGHQVHRDTGSILFTGRDLTHLDAAELRALRGRELAIVFQDSSGALNPLMRIAAQIAEGLVLIDGCPPEEASMRAAALCEEVELPSDTLGKYPHQLSGGQRQRVMIALALARDPHLLIADEPTTALDLTTQHQLLRLLQRLHRERGMALLLISHDIAVVRQLTERLIVLYAGEVLENGATEEILNRPRHPYTQGLLGAIPSFTRRDTPLATLPGVIEALHERPACGCVFAARCHLASSVCRKETPPSRVEDGVLVRCHLSSPIS